MTINRLKSSSSGPLIRELGVGDCIAIVMGTMIGSGIFLVPGSIAQELNSFGSVILLWITGGVLSLFGALSLGELGAAMPEAGGLYVYLTRAYGRPMGFLYGWTVLVFIHSGMIATMAVGFGTYVAPVLHLTAIGQGCLQIGCILTLTAVHCLGVRLGKTVQNILTGAKVIGLCLLVVLLLSHGSFARLHDSFWPHDAGTLNLSAFGIALIAVLWAYDGWHLVSLTAGETKDAARTLPRALFAGTGITALIYIATNVAYYSVLDPAAIRSSNRVAAVATTQAIGPVASVILTGLIAIAILGAMNGNVFTTPRITWAMSRDGLFFQVFGRTNRRFQTPAAAIIAHGIWAAVLTLIGSFQELFTYVIFLAWISYGLAVAAVIVLRVKQPDLTRPYRCPGYPFAPLAFLLATAFLTLNTIVTDPKHALIGLGLALCGLPMYVLFRFLNRQDLMARVEAVSKSC
jgi:APA family basic amino acid/polyamine antiporter